MFIDIKIAWGRRRNKKEHKAEFTYDSPQRQPKAQEPRLMPQSRNRIEYKRKNDVSPLGFADDFGCHPQ